MKSEKNNLDRDHEMNGKIIKFIPNSEISYTWHFQTRSDFNKETIVTWKFESLGKNKTKVIVRHSGFAESDREQYDEHSAGWTCANRSCARAYILSARANASRALT